MYEYFFVGVREVYPYDGRHRRCSYVKLHGVISQKTVFVVTAFRRNVRMEIHKWEKTTINPKRASRYMLRLRTGKSKVVRLHVMKAHKGSRGIAPQFLKLGT
jgi:hypothetical protein